MARPLLRSPPAVALLAGALAVRLAVVRLTSGYVPHHDDRSYLTYAVAIDRTGGLPVWAHDGVRIPTAYRAPGFPALLAAARAVAGPELGPLRIAQALVGVALVALVGVVAAQLWGRRAGLAALALAAVSPPLVLFGASLVSEPLYAALETAAMAAALRARRERHHPLGWALATGALGGAAALTAPGGARPAPGARARGPAARARRPGAARRGPGRRPGRAWPWSRRGRCATPACCTPSCRSAPRRATRWPGPTTRSPRATRSGPGAGTTRGRTASTAPSGRPTGSTSRRPTPRSRAAALRYVAAHPAAPLEVGLHDGARLAGLAPRAWSRLSLGTVSLGVGGAVQDALRAGLVLTTLLAVAGAAAAPAALPAGRVVGWPARSCWPPPPW